MSKWVMLILVIMIGSLSSLAFCNDRDSKWVTPSEPGCKDQYRWSMDKNKAGQEFMIIDTAQDLLKETMVLERMQDVVKKGTKLGISLFGKFSNHSETQKVLISRRQILVFKYPLPMTWTDYQKDIISLLKKHLCK